jgi:aryl-alcohol dehydrogenase-like predicted oxidoreductase
VTAREPAIGRIAFGGGTIAGAARGVSEDDAREIIGAAFDAGVRTFDTASMYAAGKSEQLIGDVIAPMRDQIRLVTKGGVTYPDLTDLRVHERDSSYDGLRRSLDGSLGRLRTDHVDAFLIHQQDPSTEPEQAMENLQRLVDEGLTRAAGFSNFGSDACQRALATGIPTYVEYSLSLLDRRYVNDLTAARDSGCRRLTYGTFLHGLLSEELTETTEFREGDWRQRARTTRTAVNSGSIFYEGDAYAENVHVAGELRAVAQRTGLSLAAFVLALTQRDPVTDLVIMGCRSVAELHDDLSGLAADIDDETLAAVDAVLASAHRPDTNRLGAPVSG